VSTTSEDIRTLADLHATIDDLARRVGSLETAQRTRETTLTIVVFSGDMDRAQAAFNIATGAASLGMQATLFFTFWGLSVITRRDARGGADALHRALGILHRPGTSARPLSRFHLGGLGPALFHRLMRRSRIPDLESQLVMAHQMGVKLVACTVTMGLLGIDRTEIRPEVESFAGVVTYLTGARAAGVSLFV
jgi:peroxiredoxin family protein